MSESEEEVKPTKEPCPFTRYVAYDSGCYCILPARHEGLHQVAPEFEDQIFISVWKLRSAVAPDKEK